MISLEKCVICGSKLTSRNNQNPINPLVVNTTTYAPGKGMLASSLVNASDFELYCSFCGVKYEFAPPSLEDIILMQVMES